MASTSYPTNLADLQLNDISNNKSFYANIKALKKSTLSIHNRLNSILSDSKFVKQVSQYYDLPLIANERCGSWYIDPNDKVGSTYFKSTDGHHGQWDFSLRRLNLQLLPILGGYGGAVIVDSTRRGKNLPDALSKAVPIWVTVVNRTLFPKRVEYGRLQRPKRPDQLGESEVSQIENRLDQFVQNFKGLGLDLKKLRRELRRPVRIEWAINGVFDPTYMLEEEENEKPARIDYNTLVLCSASRRVRGSEVAEGGYIQGAGDDSEEWSHGLTPRVFRAHMSELLSCPEDDLLGLIEGLLRQESTGVAFDQAPIPIKPTKNIFISAGHKGTMEDFDLIINCNGSSTVSDARILDLCCRESKLGSKDLRNTLGAAKSFVTTTFERNASCKILVTCSTGTDLSVGVALVLLCLFYDDDGRMGSESMPSFVAIDKQLVKQRLAWITSSKPDANPSRATLQAVNFFLM